MERRNMAHRARVGAACGLVGSLVATIGAGALLVGVPVLGIGANRYGWAADVLFGGFLGLAYAGWISVPLGAVIGSVMFVAMDTRLTDPSGRHWVTAIGALASGLFVGLFLSVGFEHGAPLWLLGLSAVPGGVGGRVAWEFERLWSRRRLQSSPEAAIGVAPPM